MSNEWENAVLATLPDGVQLVSTLIPDQAPPRHVYRVIGPDGTILTEYATLIELLDSIELLASIEDYG